MADGVTSEWEWPPPPPPGPSQAPPSMPPGGWNDPDLARLSQMPHQATRAPRPTRERRQRPPRLAPDDRGRDRDDRDRVPHPTLWLTLAVAATSFFLRAYTAMASFETADERGWMLRSSRFWGALSKLHFADTAASSQGRGDALPGVTTMWVGTLGRGLWSAGAALHLWDTEDPAGRGGASGFAYTRTGLNVAQVSMALVTSLLLAVVVLLLVAWVGKLAAAVAGVLLATEPFLVAHGAILHTDELLALFGLAALIATALALGIPNVTHWAGQRRTAALAGALLAGAVLTKAEGAVLFLPPLGLLVGWALLRMFRGRGVGDGWRTLFSLLFFAGLVAGITFVLLNPALWGDPTGQVKELIRSAIHGDTAGTRQFFLGKSTLTPGITFYLVAIPFRVTPWLLVTAVVSVVAVWLYPATRGFGLAVVLMAVPPLAWLSISARQFDRYGLVIIMLAAVLVGIVTAAAVQGFVDGDHARHLRWAAIGAGVVVGLHALLVAPWGLAYFDPALGGSGKAEDVLRVGWGEGMEKAGGLVRQVVEMGGGHCKDVTVSGYWSLVSQDRCGRLPKPGTDPDYVVVYVSDRQGQPGATKRAIAGRDLVAHQTIRGITYVQVYGPRTGTEKKDDG